MCLRLIFLFASRPLLYVLVESVCVPYVAHERSSVDYGDVSGDGIAFESKK